MIVATSFRAWAIAVFAVAPLVSGAADRKLAMLKVGDDVYKDVIVTSVTATDVYFRHEGGFGNAKLKNLDPETQRQFRFDPSLAEEREKQHKEADAEYRQFVATNPAPTVVKAPGKPGTAGDLNDPMPPQLHARSFRGKRGPPIVVEKWMTTMPNTSGKFLLVSFWASTCVPCEKVVPTLNNWQNRFRNQLVVVGITHETELEVRRMKFPGMNYAFAFDTRRRTINAVEARELPHILLIDPTGVVRYEGDPTYLSDDDMVRLLDKYDE